MTRYLLDSDCIIDYLLGQPPAVSLLQGLHSQGDDLCTCDIVLAELYSGLRPEHRDTAERFLSTLLFLPTDAPIAQQAGAWRYHYRSQGIQLSTTDCLIAATAHAHGAQVVTGNTKDFPMPELTILTLPKEPRGGGHR
jgi:predicted nucleic acid-binding protein